MEKKENKSPSHSDKHLKKKEISVEQEAVAQDKKEQRDEETQGAALDKKRKEYSELWNKYLLLCAEFDNARKRWGREREGVVKFANSFLLKDLLVIVDEMEQALKMINEHKADEEIFKGLKIMFNNFINILKNQGLKIIEAGGKAFDPHLHEIVTSREIDGDIEQPVVLEEVQKGYLLEDKLLRPAQVIVGVPKQTTDSRHQTSDNRPETEDQNGEEEGKEDQASESKEREG